MPGEIAYVDGPHGVIMPDHCLGAPGLVFIAGGVGIAPIMSILRTLADPGGRRPLRLVYSNWRWEDILFHEEIDLLRHRLNLDLVHVLHDLPPAWTGLQCVFSEPVLREAIPPPARAFDFLCAVRNR